MNDLAAFRGKRILAVGTRKAILEKLWASLNNKGFSASFSANPKTVLTDFNGKEFDLIIFGRGVRSEQKSAISDIFKTQNPSVKIIDGLAPITNLLIEQTKQSFAVNTYSDQLEILANGANIEIAYNFKNEQSLLIKQYRLNWLFKSDETILLNADLTEGKFTFDYKPGSETFISVQINNEPVIVKKL